MNQMKIPIYDQGKTDKQYDQVITEALELAMRKNGDYGSSWTAFRPSSLTSQIFAKAWRIRSIQEAGEQRVKDSLRSELIGILNYSAMALCIMEPGVAMDFELSPERQRELMTEVTTVAKRLMQEKNHDYGEAWRIVPISALVDLMVVRLFRMMHIESNGGVVKHSEGLDANYRDLLNYAVFAIIRIDEGTDPMK